MKWLRTIYFFVGTQAELMKLFAVINRTRDRGFICKIISSGQNDLLNCPYLKMAHAKIDIDISVKKSEDKKTSNYISWFTNTSKNGKRILKEYFTQERRKDALCVVHGDTLTTTIGAWICKSLHLPYAHIESGLRSYNFFSPFPEEFDRLYGSTYSVMNFCPGKIHTEYAANRFSGLAIDTKYNTGIETLMDALSVNENTIHPDQPDEKYFMFMLHRQENIMNKKFVTNVVDQIINMSRKMTCVFIYHDQTKEKMIKYGVFDQIEACNSIKLLPRQSYYDFIKLVCHSEFITTDGCGNQQEFYYLGKPYLILRTSVEKDTEGLGWNAKVFNNDFNSMSTFLNDYHNYDKQPVIPRVLPSDIIAESFVSWFSNR